MEIDATTRYCAVLGHPVKHSASPAMHNAALRALGLNWRYLAFDVPPDRLGAVIAGASAMKYVGLNLTVPHKLLAAEFVDELDDSARTWGAVNTIRFEARDAGAWRPLVDFDDTVPDAIRAVGFNTDADAISRALREDLNLSAPVARVLLLGAGGAARTAALKLASDGTQTLFLVNRTLEKAESVAAETRQRFPRCEVVVGYPPEPVDLVVNATSLGLKSEDPLPYDPSKFSPRHARAAFDMIYRPAETPFLRLAAEAGSRTANGISMLLYQGASALELWAGQAVPIAVMRRALHENVYGR
jgi:shikimate dehydrogenase